MGGKRRGDSKTMETTEQKHILCVARAHVLLKDTFKSSSIDLWVWPVSGSLQKQSNSSWSSRIRKEPSSDPRVSGMCKAVTGVLTRRAWIVRKRCVIREAMTQYCISKHWTLMKAAASKNREKNAASRFSQRVLGRTDHTDALINTSVSQDLKIIQFFG